MRFWAVVGLVLLAGCAWAFAAETPAAGEVGARLSHGRYVIGADSVADALGAAGAEVRAEQVRLPGEVTAAVERPELRVGGAEVRGEAVMVRMRCAIAGECLPFFAEIQVGSVTGAAAMTGQMRSVPGTGSLSARTGGGDAGAIRGLGARAGMADKTETATPGEERGVLVGARVRLELRDRQMRIMLPAVAVDAGAPGTEVRVASLDRRRTYRGVVMDAGTVRGGVE